MTHDFALKLVQTETPEQIADRIVELYDTIKEQVVTIEEQSAQIERLLYDGLYEPQNVDTCEQVKTRMNEVKRYWVEQNKDYPAEWVDDETDKNFRAVSDEDVMVFASDYEALEAERDELRGEVKQYKLLLAQSKTLREDNMRMRQAIKTHRSTVWGEVDADHDQDLELYKVLDSIDNTDKEKE